MGQPLMLEYELGLKKLLCFFLFIKYRKENKWINNKSGMVLIKEMHMGAPLCPSGLTRNKLSGLRVTRDFFPSFPTWVVLSIKLYKSNDEYIYIYINVYINII